MNGEKKKVVALVEVTHQGAPKVDLPGAYVKASGAGIVAIAVSLESRGCDISATGSGAPGYEHHPVILIEAGTESTELNSKKKKDELTCIVFPQYMGWSVWSAQINKYTLSVCLVNDK